MKKLLLAILALSALPAFAVVDTGARDKISALEDRLAVLEETGSITNFVSVTNAVSLLKADAPSGNVDALTNQTVLYFKPSIHTCLRLTNNGGEANLQIGLSTNVASFPLSTNALFAGFGASDVGWLAFYGATNLLDTDGTNLLFGGVPVGVGSGFPLTNDVSFSNFSASAVGGLSFSGSTNVLSGDGTNLSYGGQSLSYEETDPVWSAEKSGYATGTPVYAETDPLAFLADGTRPLSGDASGAGKDFVKFGLLQATNGIFTGLTVSNSATVSGDLVVEGSAHIDGTATVGEDLTVYGNLAVVGTSSNISWNYSRVYYTTNIYLGTNYYTNTMVYYLTNNVYLYTNVVETHISYTTQFVDNVSIVGADIDYSLAGEVLMPYSSWTNGGSLVASGTWDFTGASVSGAGLSSAEAGTIATNVLSAYTSAVPPDASSAANQTPFELPLSGTVSVHPSNGWLQAISVPNTSSVVFVLSGGDAGFEQQISLVLDLGTNSCTVSNIGSGAAPLPSNGVSTLLFHSPYFSTNWSGRIL